MSSRPDATPTVYAWRGGAQALDRLTDAFYAHVRRDEVLAPVDAAAVPVRSWGQTRH
ncbi:hypothetical protein ABZY44_35765 [Streptomyces sp. NPDC006544]|uniref:hypothetical protein n=1 Tax=Streptomyces sp. NPDC006544 TaxID=3154583 RepID=UPI0033A5910B